METGISVTQNNVDLTHMTLKYALKTITEWHKLLKYVGITVKTKEVKREWNTNINMTFWAGNILGIPLIVHTFQTCKAYFQYYLKVNVGYLFRFTLLNL